MGYLERKILKEIEKRKLTDDINKLSTLHKQTNRIPTNAISINDMKNIVHRIRIPSQDIYDILNELENNGFIKKDGNLIRYKRR